MAEEFTLELENESTFNKNHPKLNQKQLELQYQKEWKAFHPKFDGSRSDAWAAFQKERGVLLASDMPASWPPKAGQVSEWGDGRPLFKVRFTDSDNITVADAVGSQVRTWRTKFLTDGSPGTKLALKDTGKQFYDSKTGQALQIHHEKGISEYSPYIDKTIKKLLPGNKSNLIKEGLKEYKTFSKWAHKTGRVFGDKVELYTALLRSQHVNIPGAAHWLRSRKGPFYSVKASGASALGMDHNLPGESKIPLRNPQALLDQADRTSFNPKYDITQPGSIWDEMGTWHDLTYQSSKDATNLARQIANQPRDKQGNLLPKKEIPTSVRQERIDTTELKKALPVIKKIAAKYQEAGMSIQDALEKARLQYNKIKFGEYWPKGFDTNLFDLSVPVTLLATQAKNLPKLAKAFIGPEDLLDENVLGNIGEGQARIEQGEPWQQVVKEEGGDIVTGFKDQLLTTSGMFTAMAGLSKLSPGAATAAGVGFGWVAPPLLAIGAWKGIDAYQEARGKKTLTQFAVEDLGPFVNTAKEGEALTSIPGDNTLGSSLQENRIGGNEMVKYQTQESTEWTTDLDEDEEPIPEYKYAPSLSLRGA